MNRLNGKRNKCEIFAVNVKTKGLIDTGSEISTVNENIWISLSPRPEIHVTETLEIKCVDAGTLPYHVFFE